MWFALANAVGINGILAVPVAVLWGLVIMGIDRWLVTSMPTGGTRRKLAFAAPRLVIALLLGTLISTPLVLRIFQPEINAEIPVIRQQQLSEFLTDQQPSQLRQVDNLQARVNDLQAVVNDRGQAPVNPSTDPVTQSLTRQRTADIALEQRYYHQWQCQLYGGPGCNTVAGSGPGAQAAQQSYNRLAAQINDLNSQIQNRASQLTAAGEAAAKNRLQQALEALPAATAQLKTAQAQLSALLENFRAQNRTDNGLLIRMEALNRLASNDSAITYARFLLFLLIECLPVTVKLLQQPGVYEKILAREIDKRLKIALIQEGLQRQSLTARQEEHPPTGPRPQDVMPAQTSDTEPLAVPDNLRREIESIYPFMKDTSETTAPAYREELENCFLAISQAVNELLRLGYDNAMDQRYGSVGPS
jgi:Domain of unknown function (DUF4407)